MPDQDPLKLVASIPLFALLEPGVRKPSGGLIRTGGSLFLCLFLSGFFKALTTSTDGKATLLSVMGPGEVASTERPALLALMASSPNLSSGLSELLAQRVRSLTKCFEILLSFDVPRRLVRVLLGLAQKHGPPEGHGVRIPVCLSQQEVGSMVCAIRESVNKPLRKWAQDGVLQSATGRVVTCDVSALRSQ